MVDFFARVFLIFLIGSSVSWADDMHCPAYERSMYTHWIDADHNGFDTRKEVLIRSNLAHTGPKHGRWYDPYTGRTFTSPESLQIDHVVALAEAHRSGAWAWDSLKRMDYANYLKDPRHLLAVYGPANEEKSDKDPAHWLPAQRSYQKEYVRNWLAIKIKWGLTIDEDEQSAIRKVLSYAADSVVWPQIEPERYCGQGKHPQRSKSQMRSRESAFQKQTTDCCKHCHAGHSKPCGDACISMNDKCSNPRGCACWAN